MNKPPVFLFAFANDPAGRLNLQEEERNIRNVLQDISDTRQIESFSMGATSLDDLYNSFNRFHNRVCVFHFGGHSNDTFLNLVDLKARASNLSVIMGMQTSLKLVFLNGCSNKEQVQELFKQGVKTVIATSANIGDGSAVLFSELFYKAFKSKKSIQDSFNSAAAQLKEKFPSLDIQNRGVFKVGSVFFPWSLYSNNEEDLSWTLPDTFSPPADFDFTADVELNLPEVNKTLVESTFEGMSKHSDRNFQFWEDYKSDSPDKPTLFELQARIYDSFPSILSVQIKDLFTSEGKQKGRLRLKKMNDVYMVLSKLLCGIALADLWQKQISRIEAQPPEHKLDIRVNYLLELKEFTTREGQDTDEYDHFWLLSSVYHIMEDNSLEFVIPELKSLNKLWFSPRLTPLEVPDLAPGEIQNAYHFMEYEIKKRINAKNIATSEISSLCITAEKHLGILLKVSAFLTAYQFISVNDILVKKAYRLPDIKYVHQKILLKGAEVTTRNTDPQTRRTAAYNGAVMLTKNFTTEDQPLLLSPFIIDQNAYKRQRNMPKVQLYSGQLNETGLKYQHAEVLEEGWRVPPEDAANYQFDDVQQLLQLFGQFKTDLNL